MTGRGLSPSISVSSSPAPEHTTSNLEPLLIEPRAPFRLDLTAWALRRRLHNAVDRWDGNAYGRVLLLGDRPVALVARQRGRRERPRLLVDFKDGAPDLHTERAARKALDHLLGLSVDLSEFAAMAEEDSLLGPLAARMRGLKPPRFPTVFEALMNAVACQQLSLDVGIHLLNRLTAEHGRAASQDPDSPRAFPAPEQLATLEPDELKGHGFSLNKARAIVETARAIVAGDLDLEALERLDDETAVAELTRLRGIGRWSAEYVLLRGLGRLHIFPGDDVGAHNKLRRLFQIETPLDYEAVGQLVGRWHPYAGLVYFHLLLDSLASEVEPGHTSRSRSSTPPRLIEMRRSRSN